MTDSAPFFAAIDDLVDLARESPAYLAEMLAVAPKIMRHAEPCGSKAVIATLTPLVMLYGVPDRREAEWKMFWRFYTEGLGELPMQALTAGVNDYVLAGDSEFFPKPGPLKALCDKHAWPIACAKSRLVRALDKLGHGKPAA